VREESMLTSSSEVIRCLVTYNDWWQPSSGSVSKLPPRGRKSHSDGLHPGLLNGLDERTELGRRMQRLDDHDRTLLFLWYVRQLHVDDIAGVIGISRRQCFRRRANAINALVELEDAV